MSAGTDIFWEMYNNTPAIQEEWAGVKLVMARMMPAFQLNTTNKEVRIPSELEGMKIIAAGEAGTVPRRKAQLY